MMDSEPTLAELASASGLEPRTIRSWVAQGLLPPPLTRGPAARYSIDTLPRLLAIRTMRDSLGMSLVDIRKELMLASPDRLASYASRATAPADAPRVTQTGDSALDYIGRLRRGSAAQPEPLPDSPGKEAMTGLEALERRLGQGRPESARKARAEEWLRIPITPDVELAVRGPLDAEERVRLERCADLIRDILLRSDP